MIVVVLNGEEHELPDGATLADAAALLGVEPDTRGVAAAIDREVIPRGEWGTTTLMPGAHVELLTAIQGG